MPGRFYGRRELQGSLVVDSEALIYGVVEDIEVEEGQVKLKVTDRGQVKGLVPASEIADIAEGPRMVVVLKAPREAAYRGLEARAKRIRDAIGKLAIAPGRVLGKVAEVVIAPGEAGIRVEPEGSKVLLWMKLIRDLRQKSSKLAAKLESKIDPYRKPRLAGEEAEQAAKLLEEAGLKELAEQYSETPEHIDIPWSKVAKVGDVVLVRWPP